MSASITEPIDRNAIFRVSSALGLFPFKSDLYLLLDRRLLVYSAAITFVVTVLGAMSMGDDLSPLLGNSYNKGILLAYIVGHMAIFPCSVLCVFLQRVVIGETIQAIKEVQTTFERIKVCPVSTSTQMVPLMDIATPIACTVLYFLTNRYVPGTAFGAFYGLALVGMCLVCSQYSYLVDTVGDIFDAGVDFLREMKRSDELKRHRSRINEIVNAANKLGSASGALNDIYSDQILVFMSVCFSGFSIHLYYIAMFASMPIAYSYKMLFPQMYSVLFYFYVVWRVNQSSAATSDKSKEFNTLLYQLMIDDKTNEILHNDKLRLHIAMKREVVFTACGFFNLDYTLVHSMIASATTYLVILIQFGQPAPLPDQPHPTELANLTTSPMPSSLTT